MLNRIARLGIIIPFIARERARAHTDVDDDDDDANDDGGGLVADDRMEPSVSNARRLHRDPYVPATRGH